MFCKSWIYNPCKNVLQTLSKVCLFIVFILENNFIYLFIYDKYKDSHTSFRNTLSKKKCAIYTD